jgi:hypothetical protein
MSRRTRRQGSAINRNGTYVRNKRSSPSTENLEAVTTANPTNVDSRSLTFNETLANVLPEIERRIEDIQNSGPQLSSSETTHIVESIEQLASLLHVGNPRNAKKLGCYIQYFLRDALKFNSDDEDEDCSEADESDRELKIGDVSLIGSTKVLESETICPLTKKVMRLPLKK